MAAPELGKAVHCIKDGAPDGGTRPSVANDFALDFILLGGKLKPHKGGGEEFMHGAGSHDEVVAANEAVDVTEAEGCTVI